MLTTLVAIGTQLATTLQSVVATRVRDGKLEVLFNTNPVEFKADSVLLDVQGQKRELPNDFVWIFAGGIPPYDFLKKIGIRFGMRDQTQEAGKEAKQAIQEKQALAKAGASA